MATNAAGKDKTVKESCVNFCPEAGTVYVCAECQCTISVLKGCACDDKECVCFVCCGLPMLNVN